MQDIRESCKRQDMFIWISKIPNGPSIKFQVTNAHTMSELKFSGNCLKGSRPLVHFDGNFDSEPHLKIIKEMLAQVFSTPNMHPKSKPFIDHIINFYYCDGRIWFRNYQITEEYNPEKEGRNKIDRELVEIGPRFVLKPIKILSGSFFGARLYDNPTFISPGSIRALKRKKKAVKYVNRVISEKQREARKPERRLEPDELDKIYTYDEGESEGEDEQMEGDESGTHEKSEGSKKGEDHVNNEDDDDEDDDSE